MVVTCKKRMSRARAGFDTLTGAIYGKHLKELERRGTYQGAKKPTNEIVSLSKAILSKSPSVKSITLDFGPDLSFLDKPVFELT